MKAGPGTAKYQQMLTIIMKCSSAGFKRGLDAAQFLSRPAATTPPLTNYLLKCSHLLTASTYKRGCVDTKVHLCQSCQTDGVESDRLSLRFVSRIARSRQNPSPRSGVGAFSS